MGLGEPGDGAGCHNGGITELAAKILEQGIAAYLRASGEIRLPHVRYHLGAGAIVEIDHAVPGAPGVEVLQGAHAADTAHEGVDHHLREGRGDSRVEGIAAALQDLGAHIRGPGLRADHHTFHGYSPFEPPGTISGASIAARMAPISRCSS